MAGKKWIERDLDAPRRNDEDETLRYIAADGATEKGARWWSASRHRCLAVPCAGVERVAPTHGRGSETEQEERKVRQVVVD